MQLTYDATADAFYFQLMEDDVPVARTTEHGPDVNLDLDQSGRLFGVEVLSASRHFDADNLAGLMPPVVNLSLTEAARESGLRASTLRVLLNSGRLKGRKQGRDWVVTLADLMNYLESRAPQGRPARSRKARAQRKSRRSSHQRR
jgi:uncharacterized protein YuzE